MAIKKVGSRNKSALKGQLPPTASAAQEKAGVSPSRVAFVLALTGFAYYFGRTLLEYSDWVKTAVGYAFPLDYGEGPILDQTLRMAHLESIYLNNLSHPPYTISNYTPLFIMIQVPLYWIFGPALWYGRMISVLCVFLSAFFIFLTIFTLTRNRTGAIFGGLLLIVFPYIRQWSVFNRVDGLALALSWGALYATVRWVGRTDDRPPSRGGFWLAVTFFVGSIFTRQTYALAAPVAAISWLIFGTQGSMKSRIRLAAKLGGAIWGFSLSLFLLVNVFTDGGFYLHIVTANINPFHWVSVFRHAKEILTSFFPLLILAGIFLLFERRSEGESTRSKPLVLSYLVAGSLSAATIGKTGSNVNYLFELSAALSFAGGVALAWVGSLKKSSKTWLQTAAVTSLVVQLVIIVNWNGIDFPDFGNFLGSRVARKENIARLEQIVKNSHGIVLADEYMGLIPLADKRLYFEPHGFKQLAEARILDEGPFLREIAECRFDAILLYNPSWWPAVRLRWTPSQLATIQAAYRLEDIIDSVYVLRPGR